MKWVHYYGAYHQHFPPLPNVKRILEIGVREGDGLKWLSAAFPSAELFGLDIDTSIAARGPWTLIQSSQTNITPEFVERLGSLDIVIDDGGHRPYQQASSFKKLYPILRDGGKYAIEDMHMGQKFRWRLFSMFFGIQPILRRMIAQQSKWQGPTATGKRSPYCIVFYPQLVIIKKGTVNLWEA